MRKPTDLVDLLFYFQTLQVVKLWLMALESAVNIVFAPELRLILILPERRAKYQTKGRKEPTLDKEEKQSNDRLGSRFRHTLIKRVDMVTKISIKQRGVQMGFCLQNSFYKNNFP